MILDFTKKILIKRSTRRPSFVAAILYINACLIRQGIVIEKLSGFEKGLHAR
jgi:hypothetical protein